ncbi:hypothetical protein SAMN05421820_103388 [Pedobacter steynii]|uniref:Uncharacterized protein n=1 Tax=Pedobacter steynii TaxID=430522 RepID=A0A1G9RX99_9SPHI|nr:hypothetical protein SAMN05421820_103388 [Pedobacter steynii]
MANWYVYSGWGDPFLSPNYRLVTTKPACTVGSQICCIYLNSNDVIPPQFNGTDNMVTYIANALLTQVPQPTGVGVKRFVYLRGPVS